MRAGARSRPVSLQGPQAAHTRAPAAQATRKIFNCIVDDSALVAGVKKSTRNGIKQWVKNGQIRLFVPLYALEQLSRQKLVVSRHGDDVRETLNWLDDATTNYPHAVTLQGGDQTYSRWAEVERFTVPRTLFSEQDHIEDEKLDATVEETNKLAISESGQASPSVRSSVSPVSPPTSPTKAASSPMKPAKSFGTAAGPALTESASIPIRLQPLFNYILWRIHQELDPVAALESFIFLCNDPHKAHYAKGFDIRCKRLEQLREAVSREDRDFKNRMSMQDRENQQVTPVTTPVLGDAKPVHDDEVVYKPPPRAPAAMMQKTTPNVIDPNAFGRTPAPRSAPQPAPRLEHTILAPNAPRTNNVGPARGGVNAGFPPRGAAMGGNFRGGRGGGRGRGNFMPARGGFAPTIRNPDQHTSSQIDPDSFSRPRSGGFAGRGARKLWVPT
ncbi:hypothetical protein LTR56_017606 [Elasticomyces elasticus]|nr:hypothetical protein LTR56_017606 [Elasticomyces elasticus]KAK3630789.1 hypothetical protein LTR22_021368 [Elasticomyces elasticus]KAK4909203.1 hypothetical protein LTR49_022026 [Elasticomyces elasticus]KAK5749266.1 hypothetical protein LTS12_020646 [Elasticomyces elasticus]